MARLASETVSIMLGGEPVELVPTLRAALRLARAYGTYGVLIGKIAEGHTEAIADVLAEGSTLAIVPKFVQALEADGVLQTLASLQAALIDFVISLAGPPAESDGTEGTKASDPITFEAFHEQLFEIATGSLGWTPRDAWSSTPSEILAAHKGRISLLQMVFGSSDKADAKPVITLDEKVKQTFAALGTTIIRRPAVHAA